MRRCLVLLAATIILCCPLLFVACLPNTGHFPPPPPCDPAAECVLQASLTGVDATKCEANPLTDGRQLFTASNNHPTRDIFAVFTELVFHENQGIPNTTNIILRHL